ncbi:siderophore-interacting protein [Actinospica robiniae]|uniref:siderophore-interacting protein n=1 Tax=Actinospica robiniae TaxID=304901 RepID=UPI0003FC6573|nr:siderophore-interacting protein [Actinospica robiniae]
MFGFFELEVARTRRLSTGMQRVTFRAARPGGLAEFASGGRDQRFKLFLPRPEDDGPTDPPPVDAGELWYAAWRAQDPDRRSIMRTYTVREQRREPGEIDVDFALHHESGPATRWANGCLAGDRLIALGPTDSENGGVDFRPPPGTAEVLLAGDESALPAIAGILARLGAGTRVRGWIEVGHPDDIQELPTRADAEISWLIRGAGVRLTEAVSAAAPATGQAYAWIAGEAGEVRRLRRHLVGRANLDRRHVTFTGYWRRGTTEEELLEEAVLAAAGAAAGAE